MIDIARDAKSVRLDVYVKDPEEHIYNIEMQPVKRDNLPKRSRYYQGKIDINLLGHLRLGDGTAKIFLNAKGMPVHRKSELTVLIIEGCCIKLRQPYCCIRNSNNL